MNKLIEFINCSKYIFVLLDSQLTIFNELSKLKKKPVLKRK